MATLFVSHSSADGPGVRTLVGDLQRAGHEVWLDQDLTGGEAWWRSILERIRGCAVFVFALTDSSVSSKPCRSELDYARRLGIPVLPVRIGHVTSLRLVPFSEIQIVDYRERTAGNGIALMSALNACAAARRELPQPLPAPPPLPYAYLSRISAAIDATRISPADQAAAVAELRQALETEHDAGVRGDVVRLLTTLRGHREVTHRTAMEIDAVLAAVRPEPRRGRARRTGPPPVTPPPVVRPPAEPAGTRRSSVWSWVAVGFGVLALLTGFAVIGLVDLAGLGGLVAAVVAIVRRERMRWTALGVVVGGIVLGLVVASIVR